MSDKNTIRIYFTVHGDCTKIASIYKIANFLSGSIFSKVFHLISIIPRIQGSGKGPIHILF